MGCKGFVLVFLFNVSWIFYINFVFTMPTNELTGLPINVDYQYVYFFFFFISTMITILWVYKSDFSNKMEIFR